MLENVFDLNILAPLSTTFVFIICGYDDFLELFLNFLELFFIRELLASLVVICIISF